MRSNNPASAANPSNTLAWADNQGTTFSSTTDNEVRLRAQKYRLSGTNGR